MSTLIQTSPSSTEIARSLKRVNLRRHFMALLLVAPLALFNIAIFVLPVVSMLMRAVESPEIVDSLPSTTAVLRHWSPKEPVPDDAYKAMMLDIERNGADNDSGKAAGRLNTQVEGFRSLVSKTADKLPFDEHDDKLLPKDIRSRFVEIDARWDDPTYWAAIARNSSRYTSQYLLATADLRRQPDGSIASVSGRASAYQDVFGRTFLIAMCVTLATLVLGYPLAYWISKMPTSRANLVMVLVLLPFWTSILVRISSWVVLLQGSGLVNQMLMALGVTNHPLALLFNRPGVLISMTHILLPFAILPLYSVMRAVSPTYVKAAISLGSHPFGAFWKVYFPQTLPGVGAGALLVFISALGYYITPALLGGAGDQMVSYYIAYFTNVALNWGMACALGAVLLLVTLILFGVYRRIVGTNFRLN
ncbi:ABC transporter permease [Caballeronia sp. GAWG2-1]|uniref:ABC transporter permease n=1 Tax=Caballeronia sp. GAWG2-1 TaxID=2921744 RepID=UPI0020297669|nr:ABC transporter permease [Caballeronia sp. GAWG2-1]